MKLVKILESENSVDIFYSMLLDGSLKTRFPEIYNLFGVPQNPIYHPEIDVGVHTMMALEVVKNKSVLCKLMVLCHDFGKAATPEDILPKHIGHEKRGVDITEKFLKRTFPYDKSGNEDITWFVENHTTFYKWEEMSIGKIVKFIPEFSSLSNFYIDAAYADKIGRGSKYESTLDKSARLNKAEYMVRFWKFVDLEFKNNKTKIDTIRSKYNAMNAHNEICNLMRPIIENIRS